MNTPSLVSLEGFVNTFSRKPGLVFGDKITLRPGAAVDLQSKVANVVESNNLTTTIPELIDVLRIKDPLLAVQVEGIVIDHLESIHNSLDLPHLVKAGWVACVSATCDLAFESVLADYIETKPSSMSMTIIDNHEVRVPPHSVPVFKLYGNLRSKASESKLAIAQSDLLVRRESWRGLLRSLPDCLRESPLVFIGVDVEITRTLLSILASVPHPRVKTIYFLQNDNVLDDPTIISLCQQFNSHEIAATFQELCGALAERKPIQRSFLSKEHSSVHELGKKHASIIGFVPDELPDIDLDRHRHALVDALFRPRAVFWEPFKLGLDLERTISSEIQAEILKALENTTPNAIECLVIRGEAGIGKTTLLKHLASSVADLGITTIWCKSANTFGWRQAYQQLISNLNEENTDDGLIVFCDDPWSLKVDPADLLLMFEQLRRPTVVVIGCRNSDFFVGDVGLSSIPFVNSNFEVPFELDKSEIDSLSKFLEKLGIVENEKKGQVLVNNMPATNAADILCSLWYLVPDTQSQIAESLRDQYLRLGLASRSIQAVANTATVAAGSAKQAYEFVTVTSGLRIGLPTEVLVRALQIDYADWITLCVDGRPLWGLLYDEENEKAETIDFWTRNEVVTSVLLELVNGGIGHVGEYHVLRSLLRACSEQTSIYREFVLNVLVRSRSELEKRFTYEQGTDLYEIAAQSMGVPDRVLEHHKGIWMQHKGGDLKKAYSQLQMALSTPEYPITERESPIEHIHTSMAATISQMIRNGEQDQTTGLSQIREHLQQATSPSFFNPYTAHVSAKLLFDLACDESLTGQDHLRVTCFGQALSEIEKTLQLLGTDNSRSNRYEKTITFLTNLQQKILQAVPDADKLRALADSIFESNREQVGYVALARRQLAEASSRNKGTDYNRVSELINEVSNVISDAGENLDPEILVIKIDLIVRWRLQKTRGSVNWGDLKSELEMLLANPRYKDHLVKNFLLAVTCFHLGETPTAHAIFEKLRRSQIAGGIRRSVRAYLLGAEGFPRRLQFTLRRQDSRFYLVSTELNTDIPLFSPPPLGKVAGDTIHAYIGFSMQGPNAIFNRPQDDSLQLPRAV